MWNKAATLISEAAPGRINEQCYCNRGELSPTMRELCGVQQQSFAMVREPDGGARWMPVERTWGEYLNAALLTGSGPLAGEQVRANVYIETFIPTDSEPILHHGDAVAGVMRPVGQGRAWLLGTYLGHNGTAYRDAGSRALMMRLLAACGVTPLYQGRLLLRKRAKGSQEAWIFTNPTAEAITEPVDVSGWTQARDLLDEPLQQEGSTVRLQVAALDVRVLLLSRGTA